MSLPPNVTLGIFNKLVNNITDTGDIRPLLNTCKYMLEAYKDNKNIIKPTQIIKEDDIEKSLSDFFKSTLNIWVQICKQLKEYGGWMDVEVAPLIEVHQFQYCFVFPLCVSVSYNKNELNIGVWWGDVMDDQSTVVPSENDKVVQDVLTKHVVPYMSKFIFSRLQVAHEMAAKFLMTSSKQGIVPTHEYHITYMMNILNHSTFNSRPVKDLINETNQAQMKAHGSFNEDITNALDGIQKGLLDQGQVNNASLLARLRENKQGGELISLINLVANWTNKEWVILKKTQTPCNNVAVTGGRAKTRREVYKFLEKRVICGHTRNIYKMQGKLYVKSKGEYVGLKTYLKMNKSSQRKA